MPLVSLDGAPTLIVGGLLREGTPGLSGLISVLLDAVNEATIMVGQVFTEDGLSHTIDTSGSSSLGWRSGAVTFVNASTTVKVGLAAIDTAVGPPVRAVNAANVITFDVSRSMAGGGGGITANAWQEHVPTSGSKTIANGDLLAFCVQMTALGGSDLVNVQRLSSMPSVVGVRPAVTDYLGAAYAGTAFMPNAVLTFSDGTRGFFFGGNVLNSASGSVTWNNSSAIKEYGNHFRFTVPVKIYGIVAGVNVSGDLDLVLYSDPFGTPIAQKTTSFDLNTVGAAAANRVGFCLFDSPYLASANQPLVAAVKPTTATSVSTTYGSVNDVNHWKAHSLGVNCYAVSRTTGAFTVQNANKDRLFMSLLVGGFDHSVGPNYSMGI
jgi:hypothetical protein